MDERVFEISGKKYVNMLDMSEDEVSQIFTRMELASRRADQELVKKLRLLIVLTTDEEKKKYYQGQIDKFLEEQEKSYSYP
jgi:actin-related protein